MAKSQSVPTNPPNESSYIDGTRGHLFIIDGQEARDRDYARIMTAQSCQLTEEEIQRDLELNDRQPFSLLK
jgi:hypothetical protein